MAGEYWSDLTVLRAESEHGCKMCEFTSKSKLGQLLHDVCVHPDAARFGPAEKLPIGYWPDMTIANIWFKYCGQRTDCVSIRTALQHDLFFNKHGNINDMVPELSIGMSLTDIQFKARE